MVTELLNRLWQSTVSAADVALLTLTVPIVTGAIGAAVSAAGQLPGAPAGGPPIDPQLRFEVVSVKPVPDNGR